MSGEGKVVCVTGGSGFIATWLVKLLLDRGYTVNATVRTLNDPKKTEHLLALEGSKERLHLFKAELLEEGSFDSAVSGCDGVFHTASPCFLTCNDPQVELLDPTIKGTINVLNSCAKSPSVKRVILTSSVAAMLINNKPITPETEVDETWWSDPEFCLQEKKWYEGAKTMAEQAAWKFAKEKGIDLITICPGWMIGPSLQPTLNDSCTGILKLIGAPAYPNSSFGWVNVKDIANAHIQAFEIQSASGRYCIIGCLDRFCNVIKILQESYPTLQFPNKSFEAKIGFPPCKFSQQKAESLGINFIPIEVSLKETIESFKEKQLLPAI